MYAVIWYDEEVDGLQTLKMATDNFYEAVGRVEAEIQKDKEYHLGQHDGKLIAESRFVPLEGAGGYMWSLDMDDSDGCHYRFRWLILHEQGWE